MHGAPVFHESKRFDMHAAAPMSWQKIQKAVLEPFQKMNANEMMLLAVAASTLVVLVLAAIVLRSLFAKQSKGGMKKGKKFKSTLPAHKAQVVRMSDMWKWQQQRPICFLQITNGRTYQNRPASAPSTHYHRSDSAAPQPRSTQHSRYQIPLYRMVDDATTWCLMQHYSKRMKIVPAVLVAPISKMPQAQSSQSKSSESKARENTGFSIGGFSFGPRFRQHTPETQQKPLAKKSKATQIQQYQPPQAVVKIPVFLMNQILANGTQVSVLAFVIPSQHSAGSTANGTGSAHTSNTARAKGMAADFVFDEYGRGFRREHGRSSSGSPTSGTNQKNHRHGHHHHRHHRRAGAQGAAQSWMEYMFGGENDTERIVNLSVQGGLVVASAAAALWWMRR
ncbi:hypothetical protein HK102_008738 [Quaeritorhiza haematococci]|nr:hypothetical protein HK102_008738 [Quaeritorhiza haematococci]